LSFPISRKVEAGVLSEDPAGSIVIGVSCFSGIGKYSESDVFAIAGDLGLVTSRGFEEANSFVAGHIGDSLPRVSCVQASVSGTEVGLLAVESVCVDMVNPRAVCDTEDESVELEAASLAEWPDVARRVPVAPITLGVPFVLRYSVVVLVVNEGYFSLGEGYFSHHGAFRSCTIDMDQVLS